MYTNYLQKILVFSGEVSFQPVVNYEEEENQEANTERVRLHCSHVDWKQY